MHVSEMSCHFERGKGVKLDCNPSRISAGGMYGATYKDKTPHTPRGVNFARSPGALVDTNRYI